jgi:hypothetical protein
MEANPESSVSAQINACTGHPLFVGRVFLQKAWIMELEAMDDTAISSVIRGQKK